MRRRYNLLEILGLVAAAVFVVVSVTGATLQALKPGQCRSFVISSTASDNYIPTSGRTVILQLEADTTGSSSGTEVTVSAGTEASANHLGGYYWDSDDDGAKDTNVLTGSSWPLSERGVRVENVAGYIYLDTTAYSNAGQINYCFAE